MLAILFCSLLVGKAWSSNLASRATNEDGSIPIYKDPEASVEDRISDLLPRMTLEEKVAQLYVRPRDMHTFLPDPSCHAGFKAT